MLNANNSYMHKHYIRFEADAALNCIQHYYEKLNVNQETLEHLIMQFVGMPLAIIRSRATTRKLLDIPWIFKSWDDAFAYYRSRHFQEPNERHAVTPFLTGAIEAYVVNKFEIKERIYARTQEFNLVSIEELIMTNKIQLPDVKHFQKHVTAVINDLKVKQTKEEIHDAINTVIENPKFTAELPEYLKVVLYKHLDTLSTANQQMFIDILMRISKMSVGEAKRLYKVRSLIDVCTRSVTVENVPVVLSVIAQNISTLFPVKPTDVAEQAQQQADSSQVLRGADAVKRMMELTKDDRPTSGLPEPTNVFKAFQHRMKTVYAALVEMLSDYDIKEVSNAFEAVLLNNKWEGPLTEFLREIHKHSLIDSKLEVQKMFINLLLEMAKMTEDELKMLLVDHEIEGALGIVGFQDLGLALTLISNRIGQLFQRDFSKHEPKIVEAYQVVDGVKTDIRDIDPIAEMNEDDSKTLSGDTILTIVNLSDWVVKVLELSTVASTLVRRIVYRAKEQELIGKPVYTFMVQLANGFFTYDLKNLRHAEDNFKKLKRFAQKFVKANGPSLDPQKPKTPVTQTDSKEEHTMSAKPTQIELYQTITKDPIDVKAVRALVRQLFIDSQNREPREAIIDRFMESIDVSAHKHWSFLINFMLSDDYKPNLVRLPFGEMIFAKLKVFLGKLEKAGTFDFSGIPATNDYAGIDTQRNPSLDTAKKEDVTVTKVEETSTPAIETKGLGEATDSPAVNETTDKPYEAKMAGGLVEGQQPVTAENNFGRGRETALGFDGDGHWKLGLRPMTPGMLPPKSPEEDEQDKVALKEKAIRFNILRQQFQRIFQHDNCSQSFSDKLADEIAEFAVEVKVGVEPLYPIINDQPATFTPSAHHEIFNDVMALQLIAFYLLHNKDGLTILGKPDYLRAIVHYVSVKTNELAVRSNNGKWFKNNHVTMHLNILPTFSRIEGDIVRASYMIASTLVTPERANEILVMPAAPILTDLSQVPAEYLPGIGDNIQTDFVAIGILQTMITLFTTEEIDVKKDKPKAIDDSKTKKSEKEIAKKDKTETKVEQVYRDAVVKMFGAATTPDAYIDAMKNMDGDFIDQMAKELKALTFDLSTLDGNHTPTHWAFLAMETFLAYMLRNKEEPKLYMLAGFMYSFTQFQQQRVFDEPLLRPLLTVLRVDYAKDLANVSGPTAIRLIISLLKDEDDIEKFNSWFTNSPKITLPTSLVEFTEQLSTNFFSNKEYSIFLVAYALISTAAKLNFKEKPQPPVLSVEAVGRQFAGLVPATDPFLKTTLVNKIIAIANELELSPKSVRANIELLAKTALTVCLLEGSVEHNLLTIPQLATVYKSSAPRPKSEFAVDEHCILRKLAAVTRYPTNDLASLRYAKPDLRMNQYIGTTNVLSVESVNVNTLVLLTVRDTTPELNLNNLNNQQNHRAINSQPGQYGHMQPGMPYIGQPQPGMGYYPAGQATPQQYPQSQMYGYQPQPAMYPQQYYGSQFDGPRPQPFQYPTAQSLGMQPGMNPGMPMQQPSPMYRHPQPDNMPKMGMSGACLGGSVPQQMHAQMQAYDTQRGFFSQAAQMPQMQQAAGSMSNDSVNDMLLLKIVEDLERLQTSFRHQQEFWSILSSALRKLNN